VRALPFSFRALCGLLRRVLDARVIELNISEIRALLEAAQRPGGWALFKRKTTAKLASRGWFEPAEHPLHGPVFRITPAGRAVLAQVKRETRSQNGPSANGHSG
jgi:hypothetical protein